VLRTQREVSSTGLRDVHQYPGVVGDYAANGGQFAVTSVHNPLCNRAMCQAGSTLTNSQVVDSVSLTHLRDFTDGTSKTFLVGQKHTSRSRYGQSGQSSGDGAVFDSDFPRNYNHVAGLPKIKLGQAPMIWMPRGAARSTANTPVSARLPSPMFTWRPSATRPASTLLDWLAAKNDG
jgi:hypothetical protein